ncbi:hypothetical protein RJ639_040692 [Escallonia herrerae]|uniref:Integrase catalytic domain-containing protein n=1 Tax=Escallonia herrerae TaxID=1293975 RepID=A0AA88WJ65_9ASTE|nr:hypothetical protein RJ639_040692 [Escallonia herrerae]
MPSRSESFKLMIGGNPSSTTSNMEGCPRTYVTKQFEGERQGLFLRYLQEDEAAQAMDEAYLGVWGAHQSGLKLHFRIKRMGYYWPTMVKDCLDYAKRCQACQFYANYIHQPPRPLRPTVAYWPFEAWGLDVVGPLPKSSGGRVANFIKNNLIFQYGVPRYIITDNGRPFYNTLVDQLCTKIDFKQHNSSMYKAPANGLTKAFNKTLCNLLKKVVAKSKKDWHEKIGEALWVYRTTYRTPTQASPYSLAYGVEAVLPLE